MAAGMRHDQCLFRVGIIGIAAPVGRRISDDRKGIVVMYVMSIRILAGFKREFRALPLEFNR